MASYSAEDIQVLTAMQAVRKRPGMYVGELENGRGMHAILFDLIEDLVALHRTRQRATYLRITIDRDEVAVEHDGGSFEVEPRPPRSSELELVFTALHAGGCGPSSARRSPWSGGTSVANALSTRLDVEVWREGRAYVRSFSRGDPMGPLQELGPTTKTGMRVTFTPDFTILGRAAWDLDRIRQRARELAALDPRLSTIVEHDAFRCPDGLADHVRYLANAAMPDVLHARRRVDEVEVELAVGWSRSISSRVVGFANLHRCDRGAHVEGLAAGLAEAIGRRVHRARSHGKHVPDGVIACIAVELDDPRFPTQHKDELLNPEIGDVVRGIVVEAMSHDASPAMIDALLLGLDARQRGITNRKSRGGTKR